jgi:hypothetical protein
MPYNPFPLRAVSLLPWFPEGGFETRPYEDLPGRARRTNDRRKQEKEVRTGSSGPASFQTWTPFCANLGYDWGVYAVRRARAPRLVVGRPGGIG